MTAFWMTPFSQVLAHLQRDLHADGFLRLVGRACDVRRQDHVGQRRQRRVLDRLVAVDIERRAAQLSGLQRLDYSGVVQQLATSAVDQPHALLHLADRVGVDHALGLRRQADVQRDVVGLGEDLVERCHA